MMTKFCPELICATGLAAIFFCWPANVVAEEITTLGGTVYHQAKIERIEPDGITYRHRLGVAKLPFTELPETVRRALGFDPQKAAAYTQASAARQAAHDAEDRQLVAAAEARKLAAAATAAASAQTGEGNAASASGGPAFTFRQGNSEARALERTLRSLGAQKDAQRERAAARAELGLWRFAPPVPLRQIDPKSSEDKLFTPNYLRHDLRAIYNSPEVASPPPAGR